MCRYKCLVYLIIGMVAVRLCYYWWDVVYGFNLFCYFLYCIFNHCWTIVPDNWNGKRRCYQVLNVENWISNVKNFINYKEHSCLERNLTLNKWSVVWQDKQGPNVDNNFSNVKKKWKPINWMVKWYWEKSNKYKWEYKMLA